MAPQQLQSGVCVVLLESLQHLTHCWRCRSVCLDNGLLERGPVAGEGGHLGQRYGWVPVGWRRCCACAVEPDCARSPVP